MKLYAAMMYGQGGKGVDVLLNGGQSGIDRLAKRTRLLHSEIVCDVFEHSQTQAIFDRIRALPPNVGVVIGGTSLGANNSPVVAASLTRLVDFMFGIQPSVYGAKQKVTANVKRTNVWYQPWGFAIGIGFGFGSYNWERAPGNNVTTMNSMHTYTSHPGSNDENIQLAILDRIRKLLA